jgi:hypothetical protein
MPKQPQDHKPPKASLFHFADLEGKQQALPPASVGVGKLTGRDLRDASVGGEAGQMAYLFKVLEASEPTEAALDALYAMPQSEMMDVLTAWGEHGDGDGASLGESKGSST